MLGDLRLVYRRRSVADGRYVMANLLCVGALLLACGPMATAEPIPLPRERPVSVPDERSSTTKTVAPSSCQLRLAKLAVFKPSPPITGPGQCLATDVVTVDAVLLADKHRVVFSPPATLRCPMAEAVAQWITSDVAPTIAPLGTSLRSIETLESFDCRPRNGIVGAQVSEHGHANALDVRSFKLANGELVELTNASVTKYCARDCGTARARVFRPCWATAQMPITIPMSISI
jgi:hypothetical protein